MHQLVIIKNAKHKVPVYPIHLTHSRVRQVASKEHNNPLHKYFIPKIQDYNASKKYKYEFVMYAYPFDKLTV